MSEEQTSFLDVGGVQVPAAALESLIKSRIGEQNAASMAKFFSDFTLYSQISNTGGREKPRGTMSFPLLRVAHNKSFIDQMFVRIRKDQMKRVWQKALEGKNSKAVGFKVVHERDDDPEYKVSKSDKERCAEMTALLLDPSPEKYVGTYPDGVRPHQGLKDLVSKLVEAELVIDRKVLRLYPRGDGRGVAAFHWLPGDTIQPVNEALKNWAAKQGLTMRKKPLFEVAVAASYKLGLNLVEAAYVQVVDGLPVAAFKPDELTVHISNPSDQLNTFGYGTSRLEMSIDLTTVFLYQWAYNRELFNTNYPDRILKVAGEYDKVGLEAFKQQLRQESGAGKNHRIPVISTGSNTKDSIDSLQIESVALRETPKDMLFDQLFRFLIILKAAAYQIHPSAINFNSDNGSGQSMFAGAGKEIEIEESKDNGLESMLGDWTEWFTNAIVKPRYEDLKVVIAGLNDEDEKQAVDLRTSRATKWMTRNEARSEEGLPVIGDMEDPGNPYNYPADAPISSYLTTFSMINGQGGDGGDGGGPDDQQGAGQGDGGGGDQQGGDQQPPESYQDPQADEQGFENQHPDGRVMNDDELAAKQGYAQGGAMQKSHSHTVHQLRLLVDD